MFSMLNFILRFSMIWVTFILFKPLILNTWEIRLLLVLAKSHFTKRNFEIVKADFSISIAYRFL